MSDDQRGQKNSSGSDWQKPRGFTWIYAALVLALLLSALDQLIVATALPSIVLELDATSELGWIVTAYALTATLVMPIYGKLSDRLGQRRLFVLALALFLLGSAVCGFAPNVLVLTAGRAVQGIGGGGLMIGAQSIIALLVPAHRRAAYLAPLGAVFGVAGVVGPLLGGALTDTVGWRWIFFINVPLGALALAVALWVLKLPRPSGKSTFDWLGSALLSITVTLVVLLCSLGGGRPFPGPRLWLSGGSSWRSWRWARSSSRRRGLAIRLYHCGWWPTRPCSCVRRPPS